MKYRKLLRCAAFAALLVAIIAHMHKSESTAQTATAASQQTQVK